MSYKGWEKKKKKKKVKQKEYPFYVTGIISH